MEKPITIELTARKIAFDRKSITVRTGQKVSIKFHNQDDGIPHNFALYIDSSASQAIFQGEIITGVKDITYAFTAPKDIGDYYFQCDVHPVMNGIFKVK